MQLYGDEYAIVTDDTTGKVVFAEVYDTWWQRDRAIISSVSPRYKGERYRIQIGTLRQSLPSLAGHPPENVVRIAEKHHLPPELLFHAARVENWRAQHFDARLKFFLAKHGYLVAALLLTVAASVLLFEARRRSFFLDALNHFGELSLATFLGALWCLWRHAGDWTFVATIGFLLFLAAFFGEAIMEPIVANMLRCQFSVR